MEIRKLNGTAIETSLNGTFQFILHKKDKLDKKLKGLDFPSLETADEFVIHGFSYSN